MTTKALMAKALMQFDIWSMANDKMGDEYVSGEAKTNRGLVLFCILLDVV